MMSAGMMTRSAVVVAAAPAAASQRSSLGARAALPVRRGEYQGLIVSGGGGLTQSESRGNSVLCVSTLFERRRRAGVGKVESMLMSYDARASDSLSGKRCTCCR